MIRSTCKYKLFLAFFTAYMVLLKDRRLSDCEHDARCDLLSYMQTKMDSYQWKIIRQYHDQVKFQLFFLSLNFRYLSLFMYINKYFRLLKTGNVDYLPIVTISTQSRYILKFQISFLKQKFSKNFEILEKCVILGDLLRQFFFYISF